MNIPSHYWFVCVAPLQVGPYIQDGIRMILSLLETLSLDLPTLNLCPNYDVFCFVAVLFKYIFIEH